MEVVPNSSEEGSTCEEMSQEFPPLTASTLATKVNVNEVESRSRTQCEEPAAKPLQCDESQSLSSIVQEQDKLVAYLSTLANAPPQTVVSEVRKKALVLEENLKATNLTNQAERKKLASAHSDLLSQCNSQEELSQGSFSLRSQLLQLAGKQKQLLECFKKQKEINKMLSDLEEKIKLSSCSSSKDSVVQSQVVAASSACTVSSEKASRVSSVAMSKSSSLSAALPNLVRHLRQPPSDSQTQLKVQVTSQPSAKSFTVAATNPSHLCTSVNNQILRQPSSDSQSKLKVHATSHPSFLRAVTNPSTSVSSQVLGTRTVSSSMSQAPPRVQPQQISQSHLSISQSVNSGSTRPVVAAVGERLPASASGSGSVKGPLSSDLAQPVPLVDLLKHGFVKPADGCLSCAVMGCEFKASLLEDGSIKDQLGGQHQLPQQWFKSCWSKLGHTQKKPSKKSAYTSVLYRGVPLLQICEKYSLKQVNSYLSEHSTRKEVSQVTPQTTGNKETLTNKTTNLPQAALTAHTSSNDLSHAPATVGVIVSGQLSCYTFSLDQLLRNGRVVLHEASKETSLNLPSDFWTGDQVNLSESLCQHFEQDLQW